MDGELMSLVLVAGGGALGGMARLAVGELVGRRLGTVLPWGTLTVNSSGSLLMGLLAGLPGSVAQGPSWWLLGVGLLGGYTTVSSFSLQTLMLWRQGRLPAALANVALTLGAGLSAMALGVWLSGGLA